MKKVLFKKWIPRKTEKKTGFNYETTVPGTGCYEKDFTQKGEFLAWCIDYIDDGTGASFTVALVMIDDGTVVKVLVENIKFIIEEKITNISSNTIKYIRSERVMSINFHSFKTDEEVVEYFENLFGIGNVPKWWRE